MPRHPTGDQVSSASTASIRATRGIKGVYHINAVDCVTQWELIATCEKISEAYLLPVIDALLAGFPFRILGFHADNGSESGGAPWDQPRVLRGQAQHKVRQA